MQLIPGGGQPSRKFGPANADGCYRSSHTVGFSVHSPDPSGDRPQATFKQAKKALLLPVRLTGIAVIVNPIICVRLQRHQGSVGETQLRPPTARAHDITGGQFSATLKRTRHPYRIDRGNGPSNEVDTYRGRTNREGEKRGNQQRDSCRAQRHHFQLITHNSPCQKSRRTTTAAVARWYLYKSIFDSFCVQDTRGVIFHRRAGT